MFLPQIECSLIVIPNHVREISARKVLSFVEFLCRAQSTVSANVEASEDVPLRKEPSQSSSLLDIGTRKIYSAEHDMFRESVRRFFKEEIVPYHSQ